MRILTAVTLENNLVTLKLLVVYDLAEVLLLQFIYLVACLK